MREHRGLWLEHRPDLPDVGGSINGDAIVAGGDSGSPTFIDLGGNNATLVGGLWGGSSDGTLFV